MSDNENTQSGITASILEWAKGQPFNNVMLAAILGAIVWLGHFALNTAIPTVLRQIQDGYERLDEKHREDRERLEEKHRQERDDRIRIYDKWFERFDQNERSRASSKSTANFGDAIRRAEAEVTATQIDNTESKE